MVLKSLDAISVGKTLGVMYALMGLLFGGLMSVLSLVGLTAGAGEGNPAAGVAFGIGAVILLPLFYGIGGFIGGIIMAAFYNLVASMVGGIRFELARSDGDSIQ